MKPPLGYVGKPGTCLWCGCPAAPDYERRFCSQRCSGLFGMEAARRGKRFYAHVEALKGGKL